MEFTINRSDLVRELGLSQGVVEKKSTIPILSNVLLEAEGDHLTLTATDLELGIRCVSPAKVKKPGSGTIPAKKLMEYVRLLPEGEINIKFAENQWASITAGKARTRLAGMSRESFPELPEMPDTLAELPVKLLAGMIQRTIFAISAEESRFTLNGALLLVQLGDRLLLSRKLTGNFPDFERVLPKEHPNIITMKRDELRSTLERVMQFADERSRAIKLRAVDGEVMLHSSLSDTGESEESLNVDYSGPKVDIGFNAQYLLEFLRAGDEPEVAFYFKDAGSAGELRPAGESPLKYRYVVMPMRI